MMADSRRELILQNTFTALDGAGKPAGVVVNRSRRQSIEDDELDMISLYAGGPQRPHEQVDKARPMRNSPILERRLQFTVRCRVQGTDAAVDPLAQWVVTSISQHIFPSQLLIEQPEEIGSEWDFAEGSKSDYTVLDIFYSARYATARGDLTKAA